MLPSNGGGLQAPPSSRLRGRQRLDAKHRKFLSCATTLPRPACGFKAIASRWRRLKTTLLDLYRGSRIRRRHAAVRDCNGHEPDRVLSERSYCARKEYGIRANVSVVRGRLRGPGGIASRKASRSSNSAAGSLVLTTRNFLGMDLSPGGPPQQPVTD